MDLTLLHRRFRTGPLPAIARTATAGSACLIFFLLVPVRGEDPPEHPILAATATDDLMAKDGQMVTVYGETTGSGKSKAGANFVNFKGAEFYLITFASDLKPFGDREPADAYNEKRIAVTGVLSIFRGKPQIKLTAPEQVRILEEGEEYPPKKAEPEPASSESGKAAPEKKAVAEKPAEPEKPAPKPPVDSKQYFK